MAANGSRRRWTGVAAVLAGVVAVSAAVPAVAAAGAAGKVTGLNPRSEALIKKAARASPTVAALLHALESTDVAVLVEATFMATRLARGGDIRIATATAVRRYLVVRLDVTRPPEQQIEYLGHELQHALEVAGASDVRDEASLARLMERIGWKSGPGAFETAAAVRVSAEVRRDLARR